MEDPKSEIAKYQAELTDINKQLAQLDDKKNQLIRIGVRIEGILAYLQQKEQALAAELAKAAGVVEGGAEKLASDVKQAAEEVVSGVADKAKTLA